MLKELVKNSMLPFQNLNSSFKLLKGLKHFKHTNKTPEDAYQAMIQLHGQTNGRTTRMLAKHFSQIHQKPNFPRLNSILGDMNHSDVQMITNQIHKDGFYCFEQKLPESLCAEIESYVSKAKANTWHNGKHIKQVFDPETADAQVYKYDESELLELPGVQTLISDPFFQAISAEYINANPILCSVNSWYSAKQIQNKDDHGGQLFHFDMSRAKWLNFFIYLSDVGPDDGPHCFVRKSHLYQNKKAKRLLKRGYSRISDEDIRQAYGDDPIVELTGSRGSILAVDTIGFHRGKPPVNNHRLIFEMIYASSLFGGEYSTLKTPECLSHELEQAMQLYPDIYQRLK